MGPSDPKLIICHWNSNGLNNRDKQFELHTFLLKHNIDICLLNETLLKVNNKIFKFRLPGYKIYTQNGNRGTAIAIKEGLEHDEVQIADLDVLEASGIQIKAKNKKINIVSVYWSPSKNKNEDKSFQKNDLDKIFKIPEIVFAAGDWNSKHRIWGSRVNTPRGKKLNEYIKIKI